MRSKYDVAALMALFNMLKVNLSPEIYRTLLALLCDFDPKNTSITKKIAKYIRLMIPDQMLLKCLLMSLPEDVMNEPKPLPTAEKILLPPKIHHKKVAEGLELKPKVSTQIIPKKAKHPVVATASCFAERLPDDRSTHVEKHSVEKGSQSFGRCDETRKLTTTRPILDQMRTTSAITLPYPPQSFQSRTMYPSIIGIPAGVASVLPWQPINIMPSCYIGQLPPTSSQSGLLMNATGDNVLGVDLTTKIKHTVEDGSETSQSEQDIMRSSNLQPVTVDVKSTPQSVVDKVDPANQTASSCQDLRRSQLIEQESVSRRNSDCNSLEALAALTSRIGHDKLSGSMDRAHLIPKRSTSTGILEVQGDSSIAVSTSVNSIGKTSSIQNDRGEVHLNGSQSNKNAVKSFPYSQEIKLPDGKYFLLNSSAEKKVLGLKSDSKHVQTSNQTQNTLIAPRIPVSKPRTKQPGFHYKWFPISDNTRLLSKSTKGNVPATKISDVNRNFTKKTAEKLSYPQFELNAGFGFGENTCAIHLDNESTTKLITELLRKRRRSENGVESLGVKKMRLLSDSQMSTGTSVSDVNTTVAPQLYVKIDNDLNVKNQHLPEINKPGSATNTTRCTSTTIVATPTTPLTMPSAPIIQTEISKYVLHQQSYTKETANVESKAYKDFINTPTSTCVDTKSLQTTQHGEKLPIPRVETQEGFLKGETNDEKTTLKLTSPDMLTEWDFLTQSCMSDSSSELEDEVFDSVFL